MFVLKMRKGCIVPFPQKLSEGYIYRNPVFIANVDVDKLETLLEHFITIHDEPLFFILELPCQHNDETEIVPGEVKTFHKDVYYIDGCSQEEARNILHRTAEILINDGLCNFGFGCHLSRDEIMAEKYNVLTVWANNKDTYAGFFEKCKIQPVDRLVTAWETFTQEAPGESIRVDTDGKSIYDIPLMLQDFGIYLAERREG
jgi:hypothetical protein